MSKWAALAAFIAALALVASRHELGHLDAHSWNLVRSADSLAELMRLLEPEGHPPLYFLLLRPLAAVAGPWSMQVLGVALTAFAAWLLLRDEVFPVPLVLLILASFHVLYQYAIVPRAYTLVLPLMALSASAVVRERAGFVRHAVLAAGIASTSAFGVLIAPAVLLTGLARGRVPPRSRAVGFGLVCFALAAAASVWFILSPGYESRYETRVLAGARFSAEKVHTALVSTVFPHLGQWPAGLGDWLTRAAVGRAVSGTAAATVLGAAGLWLLARSRAAAATWTLVAAAVLAGAVFSGQVAERHLGHLVLAALYLCWAHATLPVVRARVAARAAGALLVCALAGQAAIGAGVAALDIQRPSAPSRLAAAAVERAADGEPYELMVSFVLLSEAALAYLDVPAFDARCQCWTRLPGPGATLVPLPSRELVWERWCATRRHPDRAAFAILDRDSNEADPARVELLESLPTGFRYPGQRPSGVYRIRDEACEIG